MLTTAQNSRSDTHTHTHPLSEQTNCGPPKGSRIQYIIATLSIILWNNANGVQCHSKNSGERKRERECVCLVCWRILSYRHQNDGRKTLFEADVVPGSVQIDWTHTQCKWMFQHEFTFWSQVSAFDGPSDWCLMVDFIQPTISFPVMRVSEVSCVGNCVKINTLQWSGGWFYDGISLDAIRCQMLAHANNPRTGQTQSMSPI